MMEMIDYYLYIEIPYHEPFTVMVRHQTVRQAPVNRKWMIGTPWDVVKRWLKHHKTKIKVIEKQHYAL
jgi:hypothetical protein